MPVDRRSFSHTSALAGLAAHVFPPTAFATPSKSVKPAPMMPAPDFVETNGITMAVYEKGSGPAIVFCHGFPELAFSWRHQIDAVAAAGYHALTPDQRGYGLTGGPEDPSQYDRQIFCDDLAGLLDANRIDKAVFCGHDWGGVVVWAMGRLH